MELWLIILLSAVGGFLLILFITIICCVCCRRRRRKRRRLASLARREEDVRAWQAHEHPVNISDDENSPKLDGLCKDTISGSTFPRYKKEQNADNHKEDGLCEETKLRSMQRRGKLEGAFPSSEALSRSQSMSALRSGIPNGGVQIEHGFKKEYLPAMQNDSEQLKRKDSEGSSSSSSDSDQEVKKETERKDIVNHLKMPALRKRSKSFETEYVPEYTKPVKRAVSNPNFNARQSMLKNNNRFSASQHSMPIPEPDYPLAIHPPQPPRYDYTEQTPNIHSDSGVVSINVDDRPSGSNVPESPGMSLPRTPSFLAKDLTTTDTDQTVSYTTTATRSVTDGDDVTIITDYDKNEARTIPPPPPLPQGSYAFQENETTWKTSEQRSGNSEIFPPPPPPLPQTTTVQENGNSYRAPGFISAEYMTTTSHNPAPPPVPQGIFTTTTYQEKGWKTTSPSFTKVDPSHKPTANVVTETKRTTSSWTNNEQPTVDFRHIKLNPTSNKIKYEQEQARHNQIPNHTSDASRVMPSTLMSEQHEYNKPGLPEMAQPNPTMSYNTTHSTVHTNTKPANGPSYVSSETEYAKTTFTLPGSTSVTTKTTQRHQPEDHSHSQPDFRGFKLRPTPDSIKQHIGFRQDLRTGQQEENTEVTANEDKRLPEVLSNGEVGDLPSQKTYGFQSYLSNGHVPQSKYGSTTQTTTNQQSQKTYGFQHSSTQKNVTTPDTGLKVFSMPGQTSNVTRSASISKQTVTMNGSVKKHSNTTSPGLVIEKLSDDKPVPGKAVPAGSESVVMRPKKTENIPINTAGETAEDKRKNWRREQMEQRLSTALVMNERQPIMQASGLALKSVLPELFDKIKQRDNDENENIGVTIAT